MALKFGTAEEIGTSLYTAMDGIVGSNKMQRVDRQYHEDFNNYSYPSCFINDVRRSVNRVLLNVSKVVHTFNIVVFHRSESGDLSTILNSLVSDSCAALLADPTRGGKAYNTLITEISTDDGFLEPVCAAIITVEVHYLSVS